MDESRHARPFTESRGQIQVPSSSCGFARCPVASRLIRACSKPATHERPPLADCRPLLRFDAPSPTSTDRLACGRGRSGDRRSQEFCVRVCHPLAMAVR